MDGLEGIIGLIWLMFFVGSVVRAIVQGKKRAEQEAAKRAMRRAQGQLEGRTAGRTGQPLAPRRMPDLGKQVFRTGWPVYPGQPAQPLVVVEDRQSLGEGDSAEGDSAEGDDALQPEAWHMQEDGYSTEGDGRDIGRRLRQEQSDEWQSERVRTWEMPVDAGSLGDVGEALDEPMVKSADTFAVDIEQETLDWAADGLEGDARGWQLPGRVGPGQALAGIVWGTVLDAPRCRLTRHER